MTIFATARLPVSSADTTGHGRAAPPELTPAGEPARGAGDRDPAHGQLASDHQNHDQYAPHERATLPADPRPGAVNAVRSSTSPQTDAGTSC